MSTTNNQNNNSKTTNDETVDGEFVDSKNENKEKPVNEETAAETKPAEDDSIFTVKNIAIAVTGVAVVVGLAYLFFKNADSIPDIEIPVE